MNDLLAVAETLINLHYVIDLLGLRVDLALSHGLFACHLLLLLPFLLQLLLSAHLLLVLDLNLLDLLRLQPCLVYLLQHLLLQ